MCVCCLVSVCPYYTSKELKKDADIIFMPYNYLIDPKVNNDNTLRSVCQLTTYQMFISELWMRLYGLNMPFYIALGECLMQAAGATG